MTDNDSTPATGNHVEAIRRACHKTSNLAQCYRELYSSRMQAVQELARLNEALESSADTIKVLEQTLATWRASGLDKRVVQLEKAIDAHVAVLDSALAVGNRIDPVVSSRGRLLAVRQEVTPARAADGALPAFDGVEEAQMAALRDELHKAKAALTTPRPCQCTPERRCAPCFIGQRNDEEMRRIDPQHIGAAL